MFVCCLPIFYPLSKEKVLSCQCPPKNGARSLDASDLVCVYMCNIQTYFVASQASLAYYVDEGRSLRRRGESLGRGTIVVACMCILCCVVDILVLRPCILACTT